MAALIAYLDGEPFFESDGAWLHPLLELESALLDAGYAVAAVRGRTTPRLTTYDRIVGRAGALLSVRMGVREIRTDLLSKLALPVLEAHGVAVTANRVEERIFCATEAVLADVTDPNEAHRIILARIAARQRSQPPVVHVDNLSVVREGRRVLHNVSFEIYSGETVLLRGKNGAGKTTLLRALLGLLPAESGVITMNGNTVGTTDWSQARHRTAYVRQIEESARLPVSVFEVVEIGAQAAGRSDIASRVNTALHRTGAAHLVKRRFDELSGGERQRVSIARALAQPADILLLDEPTVGLDDASRSSLLELLSALGQRQGVTVLIVSHDTSPAELPGARVLTLDAGRIVADVGA